MNYNNIDLEWLGHDGFRIKSEKILYIDPFEIKTDITNEQKADIILITHSHYDHCSVADLNKVIKDGTVIIAPTDCISKLSNLECEVKIANINEEIDFENIKIIPVPAYNINKQFHPKDNDWVGYIIDIDGTRVYHAGDTDLIPEMKGINAEIALLPVSGTYVMTAEEAAEACKIINPRVAIPMHYDSIVGTRQDAERFRSLVKNTEVYIFE